MNDMFKLKNPKDNIHLLAFQYHALVYSMDVLQKLKKELKDNPILKYKIDNYLMMQRILFEQKMSEEQLPFDIKSNIESYLNNPNNSDLKKYMNICNHIIAKKLDMSELLSKLDFYDHQFVVKGKDLICVDCNLSTIGNLYNDIEKNYLYNCARHKNRIVSATNNGSNIGSIYSTNKDSEINNLVQIA